MTIKIDREAMSISPEEFGEKVDAYAARMAEYGEHLKGVEADAANPDLAEDERRVAFPPPDADQLVKQAVAEGYEIVGPSFEVRKQRLLQRVSEAEQAELNKIVPPGKRRYFDLQEQAICAQDQKRLADYLALGHKPPDDFKAFLERERPTADTDFLAEQVRRSEAHAAVVLGASKQMHDIEDLTEETVDAWEMTPLNG